jgi:thioester reductase-like protein
MAFEATRKRADRGGDAVLLTGATGFVGMQVLARYLERTSQHVYVLVRGSSSRHAKRRIERCLALLFGERNPYRERVTAVCGDLRRPGLGLGAADDRERLAEQVTEIVHAGASVSFGLDLQESRAINVEGTRRVLELGERCQQRGGLRRLSHISTAYVSGEHDGCFSEDELDVGQTFRNSYEQSKFEAELLVQEHRGRLPITVLRPSIVVGESSSGWTTTFNVLYWPIKAFARGAYAALPARRQAPVDVVPVDYVADAILELTHACEAQGATFHLTAGRSASSVGELVDLTTAYFDRPAPRLLDPSLYRRAVHPLLVRFAQDERRRRALQSSEVFFPYFATKTTFDERRARVALRRARISAPPLAKYFTRLVEFALAAEWGRRQLARPCPTTPPSLERQSPAPWRRREQGMHAGAGAWPPASDAGWPPAPDSNVSQPVLAP